MRCENLADNFLKVGLLLNLLCTMDIKLTFENYLKKIDARVVKLQHIISQKSAHHSVRYSNVFGADF